jgi:hypothetical protein
MMTSDVRHSQCGHGIHPAIQLQLQRDSLTLTEHFIFNLTLSSLPSHHLQLALHVVEERRAMSEAVAKRTRKPVMHLTPPFPCCYARHKPISVAATWLFQCQLMTMQFVMMKPILTALPFILRLSRTLDYDGRPPILNNTINPYSPKLYIQVQVNPPHPSMLILTPCNCLHCLPD